MKKFILFACCILNIAVYAQPGSLDNTFGIGGKVTTDFGIDEGGYSVAIQSNGKIVVAGSISDEPYVSSALARYNSDGTLDNSFGTGGKVITSFGSANNNSSFNSVVVQSDGKIVAAGRYIVRYNFDGTLDNTFGLGGKVIQGFLGTCIKIQPDGKLVVAGVTGNTPNHDFALARYNGDGSLDSTFSSDGKVNTDFTDFDICYTLAIQNDGKIVVAGWCDNGASQNDFALARYNNDGTLDNSFDSDGKVIYSLGNSYDYGHSVAIQSDGKIVVAGSSQNGGTDYDFAVVRFNYDGSLDNTFDSDGKVTTSFGIGSSGDYCYSVAIQHDGKIVLAGSSVGTFALVRYNSDGTLDSTFGSNGKIITAFGSIEDGGKSVVIQSDGKIVVAGFSYNNNRDADFAIARFNGDMVGIKENSEMSNVNIYPNPTSGIYTVILGNNCRDAKICVYDAFGNSLLNKNCRNDVNPKVDLSGFAKGIYFMEIVSDGARSVNKIVLQ